MISPPILISVLSNVGGQCPLSLAASAETELGKGGLAAHDSVSETVSSSPAYNSSYWRISKGGTCVGGGTLTIGI